METESYGIKICTVEGSFVLITVHHSTILVKQAGLWCTHTHISSCAFHFFSHASALRTMREPFAPQRLPTYTTIKKKNTALSLIHKQSFKTLVLG